MVALVLSLFSSKARKWIKGRKALLQHVSSHLPTSKRVVWFHAASLGEFEQGRPVIEAWREHNPEDFILLTFYSPSGYDIRKDYRQADLVCYLPFDFRWEVRAFIEVVKPDIVVFIKYEFWPNLLRQLSREKVSIFLLSARFRPEQLFFRWYGKAYFDLLKLFTAIMVQDERSKELLMSRGISRVSVTGDTRVDQVLVRCQQGGEVDGLKEFSKDSFVLIGGSTWFTEERILQRYYLEKRQLLSGRRLKIIIAPHDIREGHLRKIENLFGEDSIRYSSILQGVEHKAKGTGEVQGKGVLIIDRIGLLPELYKYGDIAFIGGAFRRGLHNILEPAVQALPIIFGPHYNKFSEAVDLVQKKAAFSIRNHEKFISLIAELLSDEKLLVSAGAGSKMYVQSQSGATALSISCLMENV